MSILSITLSPPHGSRWIQSGSELELQFADNQQGQIVEWLRSLLGRLTGTERVRPIEPTMTHAASAVPIVSSVVRPAAKESFIDGGPQNLVATSELPIEAPSLEDLEFLRKVVNQAARVWPKCRERSLLVVNTIEGIFYNDKGEARSVWHGNPLPPIDE